MIRRGVETIKFIAGWCINMIFYPPCDFRKWAALFQLHIIRRNPGTHTPAVLSRALRVGKAEETIRL